MRFISASVRRLLAALALVALAGAGLSQADSAWPGMPSPQQPLPSLEGASAWINSPPLDAKALQGKVVLVDFWTHSCINCLRTLPYVRAWAQKYGPQGLLVIGVHTPEFGFERMLPNVQRAVKDLGIAFPVAVDSEHKIWRAFETRAWPTFYFVDAQGRIRHRQLGEGRYDQAERVIQQLLREAGRTHVPTDLVSPQGHGTQATAGSQQPGSDETYLGTARAEGFVSAGGTLRGGGVVLHSPARSLRLNQWTLSGRWQAQAEQIQLAETGGRLSYRFRARDLHLVLGPSADGRPVRYRVTLDGKRPGEDHGSDTDPEGQGLIDGQRLYQLVRQRSGSAERVFEIEFLDSGAQAYAFTFG